MIPRLLPCAAISALTLWGAVASGQPASPAPSAGPQRIDPERALERANRAFTFGDYQAAVDDLTPAVEPEMRISGLREQARALELLGLCHWYLGQNDLSRRYFRRLILVNPDKTLDPRLVPPPIIEFYEDLRRDLADDIKRSEAELRKRIEEEERLRQERSALIKEVSYKENSQILAVMPFGVGQFQNGDDNLGWFFLVTEAAAVAISIGSALAIESLRQPNLRFKSDEVDLAQNLRTTQIVSAGAALGLMLVGAAQAMIQYEPRQETQRRVIRPGGPAEAPAGATILWRW